MPKYTGKFQEFIQDDLYDRCAGLVDSEWEALEGFTKKDLWDYLFSLHSDITRETSDRVFERFAGESKKFR